MTHRRSILLLFIALTSSLALASCSDGEPYAQDMSEARIIIAGSSTVAPFVTSAAEYFGVKTDYDTPVVETTGTGGGFKIFCQGNGANSSSIATASRPVTESERQLCQSNGVTDFIELGFGSDGIVFMNSLAGPEFALTDREIYLALAAEIPVDGELVPNPYQFWSEINPALPNLRIEVYGPPPTSGTRDALAELALKQGALTFPELRALKGEDLPRFREVSQVIRTDGRWLDAGENDTQIIQTLLRNSGALGVAGFSYLSQSGDRVKPARINGVAPGFETILSNEYPLSRSLYLYVKAEHLKANPAMRAFLEETYSDAALGDIGYLVEKGLIPPTEKQREEIRAAF